MPISLPISHYFDDMRARIIIMAIHDIKSIYFYIAYILLYDAAHAYLAISFDAILMPALFLYAY